MRAYMMRLANNLISALDECKDDCLVDEILNAVTCNELFDEDDIAAAEEAEAD